MADLARAIVDADAAGDEGRVAALSAEIAAESNRRWEQLPAARRDETRSRLQTIAREYGQERVSDG